MAEKSVEKSSSKLKIFILFLIFAILASTVFFYAIQEELRPSEPSKNEPKKSEEHTPQTNLIPEQNKPEKKVDDELKKTKEPDKAKSTLIWPEFSQKLKAFEDKRQEILTAIEQKLSKKPPDTISSLQTHDPQTPIINETNKEEKTSWDKVIQHWQQLNDQQQRLTKQSKSN